MKQCKICLIEKDITEFHPCGKYKDKIYYRGECRECNSSQQKSESGQKAQEKYRNSEKGKVNKHKHKKTERYLEWQRNYEKNKLKNNPLFKLKKYLRDRTRKALKSKQWYKISKLTQYIGCSMEQLKLFLEMKFTSEMTWENHGIYWEIDHIVPLALAKSEEELYKLCHYTNLQPLSIQNHQLKSIQDTKQIKSINN